MSDATNAALAREALRQQGFDCPASAQLPAAPGLRALWPRLLREEVTELESALERSDLVEVADAIADILFVAYQAAANCGLPIDAVFAEVHRSNLTKIPSDGPVAFRSDGKVLKPPGYSPPDIQRVLDSSREKPK